MKLSRIQRQARLAGKSIRQKLAPSKEIATLIVAGCQRSGTNMVMSMLERHPDTVVYHERDSRAYDNYIMKDLPVIGALRQKCNARHFVIKALCELHMLDSLRKEFAPAKILWVVRRWPDVTNSLVRSFSGFADHLQAISSDRESAGWRGLGMSDATHQIVKEVAATQPDELSSAALQWYFRNVLYLESGLHEDPEVMLLSYEELVSSPEACIAEICGFAGVPAHPALLGDISPRSIGKNPAPAVNARVESLCDELYSRLIKGSR